MVAEDSQYTVHRELLAVTNARETFHGSEDAGRSRGRKLVRIPEGEVIRILTAPNTGGLVEVEWLGRRHFVFAKDVELKTCSTRGIARARPRDVEDDEDP